MLDLIRQSASSWGVKILFGVIILVFVFWGVGSFTGSKTQVVATVNERPILVQTFRRAQERAIENIRQRNPDVSVEDLKAQGISTQVLQRLVADELLADQGNALGIRASDVEVRNKIASLPYFQSQSGQFDPELYRRILNSQHIQIAEFEDDMRRAIVTEKLQRYVTDSIQVPEWEARDLFDYSREKRTLQYLSVDDAKYMDQVNATDAEVQAYYDEHKDDFSVPARISFSYLPFTPASLASKVEVSDETLQQEYEARKDEFTQPERVKARHILIQLEQNATEAEDQAALEKIEAIRKRIVDDGEDFATVAEETSDGPSAPNGGDLGWFSQGQMVPAFEEAAFSLTPGTVSEPVRTPFGYHLILVEEREDAQVAPFDEVKDQLKQEIAEDRATDLVSNLLDVALEQVYAGDSLDKVAGDLNLEVLKTDEPLDRDQVQSLLLLKQDSLNRLFGLEEGMITDTPLETEDGYVLATIGKRLPPDFQPLDEVRDSIVTTIKETKASKLAKEEAEALSKTIQENGLPADRESELSVTSAFDRQGLIQELGVNPELTSKAFNAEKGDWIPGAWPVQDGWVVVRLDDIQSPTDEQWETEKSMWVDFIAETKKEELFQSFLKDLQEHAEINVYQPDLFK